MQRQEWAMSRWTRFAAVGLMGLCVQLATLHVLTRLWHMHYVIAVVMSVEMAILHNFVWHERWTWRDRRSLAPDTTLDRLVRFNAASGVVSLVGNVAFTALFVTLAGLPVIVGNIAAITCLTIVNFFVADRLAFRSPDRTPCRPRRTVSGTLPLWRRAALASATLGLLASTGRPLHAAELTSETVAAWERYVARVESRLSRETQDAARFLATDFAGRDQAVNLRSKVRRGEIVVDNVAGSTLDVGAGTISHWRGYVFVPAVTIAELLDGAALRGRGAKPGQEDVLDLRVLGRDGNSLRLFLKLQRKAIVTVAFNTEHLISYVRYGPERAASRSVSTRIAELRDAGTPEEREKPVGQDRGFMWRLHSYWRYQAVPGGVIVELESITLSRDIPWPLRAVAGPIIDRIARESMTRTLASLRSRWAELA